ncbi:hypothetical protein T12_12168 [Trichinella patagoniensis]|uniref:Uncharacterized protein n=1 Tax=Trichinella patagoniensis TaxID=990121 RepID=A0A0V1AAL0_9BILA|nr:hypothetical protein T12_12168 [Trichinella patagoniensis]
MVVKCGFSAATGQKGRGYQKSPGDLPLFYQVLFPDIKLTMHVKANDLTTQSRKVLRFLSQRLLTQISKSEAVASFSKLAYGPLTTSGHRGVQFGRRFQGRNLAENSATVGKSCIVLLHAVGVQWQLRADKGGGSRMKSMEVAEAERVGENFSTEAKLTWRKEQKIEIL